MISPNVSSATDRLFECGSLNTAIPRSLEAVRSILSTPIQNAPTATSSGAASSTADVIRVFERTTRIDAPGTFATNSFSSSAPLCASTSNPASWNCVTATPLMFSSNKTSKNPPVLHIHQPSKNYKGEPSGPLQPNDTLHFQAASRDLRTFRACIGVV